MAHEHWKPVPEYEGLYEVSDRGNVRSTRGNTLSPSTNNGYRHVNLTKEKKHRCRTIHRLVALAFLERPEGTTEVNHIDGNKGNNHLNNLEWVSRSDNLRHAYAIGLMTKKGDAHPQARLSSDDVFAIRAAIAAGRRQSHLAREYNVSKQLISAIKQGHCWAHLTPPVSQKEGT